MACTIVHKAFINDSVKLSPFIYLERKSESYKAKILGVRKRPRQFLTFCVNNCHNVTIFSIVKDAQDKIILI